MQHPQPRARDFAGERFGVANWEEGILGAVHDQRGCGDLAESFAPPGRAVQRREGRGQVIRPLDSGIRTDPIEDPRGILAYVSGHEAARPGQQLPDLNRTFDHGCPVRPVRF
ncbi:hypothetical protein GCM10009765_69250 [Fodinicola feengrottensis]|uniref:Uncharacterized protein n=1 Tax=Fodinicola feengrottensis TaxID=435914 RepID=A0ABN2IR47_9ACTN